MPTLVIDGLTALADHIRAEQNKAKSRGFIRTVKDSSDATERSYRSFGSGEDSESEPTIFSFDYETIERNTVLLLAGDRFKPANGQKVRTFLDCESSFNPRAAILRNLSPAVGADIRRENGTGAKEASPEKP